MNLKVIPGRCGCKGVAFKAVASDARAAYNGPMRQYERYLLAHLLWPTVLITAALTGIVWLTQMLRFIDFMLNRGLTLGDFLYLTGLMLPALLLIILPIALCIAVIFTYNRLTADSELIVLNAVGVSKLQLARPVLAMGACCAVVCYMLALFLMPIANKHFQDIRTFFRDKYASVLLEEEVFNSPIDGVTVFVRERGTDDTLKGVLLHDNRNPAETVTMLANRGRMEQTETGPRFYLVQGVRQQWKEGRVSWLTFDSYALDIAFFAQDIERRRDPDERTIFELFSEPTATEKERAEMRAEAHHRLTWPLMTLALPMLAIAVLFSGEFNRRGQWRRIVIAAVSMLLVVLVFFALRNLVAKQGWLVPALYLTVFGPIGASIALLRRDRALQWRKPVMQMPAGAN